MACIFLTCSNLKGADAFVYVAANRALAIVTGKSTTVMAGLFFTSRDS